MTKNEAKTILSNTAKKYGRNGPTDWKTQEVHKLAVVGWILDMAKVTDPKVRNAVRDGFISTPSGFGCNASQHHQWIDKEDKKVAAIIENLPQA